MRSEKYAKFVSRWDTIEEGLVNFPDRHQKFFFDFLFRLMISLWDNFTKDECEAIKLIASKFYRATFSDIEVCILKLSSDLPIVKLEGAGSFTSVSGDVHALSTMVKLLGEIISEYEVLNAYTFDESISFLPQELNYPPNSAIQILEALSR